jgi:transposase
MDKRKYEFVDIQKRLKLVEIVEQKGYTIKEASRLMDINYSTAKHIIKEYKRTGTVETQLMKKQKQ